jgi:hypothetical protein
MTSLLQVIMTSDTKSVPSKYGDLETLNEQFKRLPLMPPGCTNNFYDMAGDVTSNTATVDNITNLPHVHAPSIPPSMVASCATSCELSASTTFDSLFLGDLTIPRPTEPEYQTSFFDQNTS